MTSNPSVPFSELLRQPRETTERLSQVRALHLSRRDAEDLVLTYAARATADLEALDATARVLAAVARHDRGMLADLLPAALPWTRFLPAADRELMTEEFVATAEAAASAGTFAPLAQVLTEWKHTAQIHADPDLHHALTRTELGDHGPVPAPMPIPEPR